MSLFIVRFIGKEITGTSYKTISRQLYQVVINREGKDITSKQTCISIEVNSERTPRNSLRGASTYRLLRELSMPDWLGTVIKVF